MGHCVDANLQKIMTDQDRFHRFRYHIARGFVEPGDVVLDLGSGSGYGPLILSRIAKEVIGIEIDQLEIDEAIRKYGRDNIKYIKGNIEVIEMPESDITSAFEVLEHCYCPEDVIQELKKKTKKYIIVSVPIGMVLVWVEKANEFQERNDEYHKSVFTKKEDLDKMFIDDIWIKFWSYVEGVNYIAVYYNTEGILKT